MTINGLHLHRCSLNHYHYITALPIGTLRAFKVMPYFLYH